MTVERLVELAGDTDGVNRVFATPSPFVEGSIRVFVRGVLAKAEDLARGWVELNDSTVELATPPREGDVVQAFYRETTISVMGNVVGSPFSPDELC